jgi:parallel beta-helix repeat protein
MLGLAAFGLAPAAPAKAAKGAKGANCPQEAVRWDSTVGAIYVVGSVTCTLSDIHAAATTGPIYKVDPAGKVWLLGAELALLNGATLEIRGGKGGDANELRLLSNNSSSPGSVAALRADWGTIKIRDTRITSWDEAAGGPDTEHETFGRAFIKARSYLDGTTPRESRLDVTNSDVGYLGAFGDEMSGLSWKLAGSSPEVHANVGVFGDVTGSRLHDNYSGAYTDGAQKIRFTGNEIHHNVVDGISLNDQSGSITVENNSVHDNGRYGIVCSQGCDKLAIRGNRSTTNISQGIMLRGIVGSVVEKNEVTGNAGAGIALSESNGNLIRTNRLGQNAVGLRFSLGSSDNRVESNEVSENTGYGLHFYSGTDAPTVGDGRPRRNHVVANSVSDNKSYAVRITDSDENVFERNTYAYNGGDFSIEAGNGNVIDPPPPPPPGTVQLPRSAWATKPGYWLAASDGGVFAFGEAPFRGSTGEFPLNQPITGMASTPTNEGYWLVASDGGIFSFGDAPFLGSTGGARLNRPIVAMTAMPSGAGYRLVASDGGVFAFGDAGYRGSVGSKRLNHPIVGMATTPSGRGYWLVASDGGVFAFGSEAVFSGSAGNQPLNQPIVGMAATPTGGGYWLVAADGGIFTFGDATFYGSTGNEPLNQPIVGMAATPTGAGYWLLAADGGVFAFGDAPFLGSAGRRPLAQPTVSVVSTSPAS